MFGCFNDCIVGFELAKYATISYLTCFINTKFSNKSISINENEIFYKDSSVVKVYTDRINDLFVKLKNGKSILLVDTDYNFVEQIVKYLYLYYE